VILGPRLSLARRHTAFVTFLVLTALLFRRSLYELYSLALRSDGHSYILIIIPAVLFFVWLRREQAFASPRLDPVIALLPICVGVGLQVLPELAFRVLGIVLIWLGGFGGFYGRAALRTLAFPALLLVFLVPLPEAVIEGIVHFLRWASASLAFVIFRLFGVPVFRDGFTLSMPGVDIEVAKECSGIRSSTSLLLATVIAGGLFLRSGRYRLLLALSAVPILILKNSLRIVTITMLGLHVDSGFFYGAFHRNAGLPFSALAMFMILPVFLGLYRADHALRSRKGPALS
jgi:exosortase